VPRGITRVKASSMLENTAVAGNIANASLNNITAIPTSIDVGDMVLLQTQTASSSATIDFTSNIDSTYDSYVFKLINIHAQTDQADFTMNFSTDGGSNYNVTKTTTVFEGFHKEDDSSTSLSYNDTEDIAQGTGFQNIANSVGNNNDDNCNGVFHLFNPSSSTFVKHFLIRMSQNYRVGQPAEIDWHVAGYANTTSAINAVQFKFTSGNIDSGDIKLYGIK
jgi:hypothetical protein